MSRVLSLDDVRAALQSVPGTGKAPLHDVAESLQWLKREAVAKGDEVGAKCLWCLEQVEAIQRRYVGAFEELKSEKYYEAWCSLEQVELKLHFLGPHGGDFFGDGDQYSLPFIRQHTAQFQSLYPYAVFISPEIIEIEKKCTICGQIIAIRRPCGHRVGEVYKGELCGRIVSKSKFVGTAFVRSPVQKYSVPFLVDPKTRETIDQYDYSLVRYVARRLASPFHGWRYELKKARHPHERFRDVGRNDPCPCESGLKYKKCCLNEAGVLRPHYEFLFDVPPPKELMHIEFSA